MLVGLDSVGLSISEAKQYRMNKVCQQSQLRRNRMRTLAIINASIVPEHLVELLPKVTLSGTEIQCGIVDLPKPKFDSKDAKNSNYVLVKVDAFSCNYRDKALILQSALNMNGEMKKETPPIVFFGSDFVGTIIEMGENVNEFKIGDRVIPDCSFPEARTNDVNPGVATNEASRGWLKIHKSKLLSVPTEMDDATAGSFSIGAQTSSSMIRRTINKLTDRVLVTSARSNTSQFIINGLINKGIETVAVSTSKWSEAELEYISPVKIVKVEKEEKNWDSYDLGKFDVIFDPYYDLHITKSLNFLNVGGRYITCGFKNQHQKFSEETDLTSSENLENIFLPLIISNISIIGNCIGTSNDLKNAIKNYNTKNKPIQIDGVFTPEEGSKFLNRTYNTFSRFGKAVISYKSVE